jgi:hypothetical protein
VKPARVTLESTVMAAESAAVALEPTASRSATVALGPAVSSRSTAVTASLGRIPDRGEPQRESEQDGEGCADWLHALETLPVGRLIRRPADSASEASTGPRL